MINRRDALKLGAVGGVALALPAEHLVSAVAASPASIATFHTPLPIPPVLSAVRSDATTDYYELSVQQGAAQIQSGISTQMVTYNGSYPGPTIMAKRGRSAKVTVTNRLQVPTAVHLHGGIVPQHSDGHPLDVIQPGQSRVYEYPNVQRGATLWYHDHAHHLEAENIYRGLAGFYLIDDIDEAPTLPRGEFDIPLMFRDVALDDSGQLLWAINDTRRNLVLVNGVAQPILRVKPRKYRFRMVNAANARNLSLRLENNAPFTQIGADGGLLAQPAQRQEIELTPGERADVVLDFSSYSHGTRIIMRNTFGTADSNIQVMKFEVDSPTGQADTSTVPARLGVVPATVPATVTRKFVLSLDVANRTFLINGRSYDPHRIDFTVKRGSTEIWEVTNADNPIPHSMHIHITHFKVLDRNGQPVPAWEAYPKDTVSIKSGETVRLQVTFDAPFTGVFPFHCHFVDHSSMAMMGQFELVP